jgi:hypothetical protein
MTTPDEPWEGSRPRPAAAGSFPKPKALPDQGRKYTLGFENPFTARGDARPPQSMALRPMAAALYGSIEGGI